MGKPTRLFRVLVANPARYDISAILKWTKREFGIEAAGRYKKLIDQALEDLKSNPELPGSKTRPDVMIDTGRIYHLQFSRDHVASSRMKAPRHFLLYQITPEGVVLVARVLHDQFDLSWHLPEEFQH